MVPGPHYPAITQLDGFRNRSRRTSHKMEEPLKAYKQRRKGKNNNVECSQKKGNDDGITRNNAFFKVTNILKGH